MPESDSNFIRRNCDMIVYLHVRSPERCTGRDTCEFPRATVPESDSKFLGGIEKMKIHTCHKSRKMHWERYL